VLAVLKESGANRELDLGCGAGKLLRELLRERTFTEIVGVDVSCRALESARERLHRDRLPPAQQQRVKLLLGSLTYRDRRLAGYEGAVMVEVAEYTAVGSASRFALAEAVGTLEQAAGRGAVDELPGRFRARATAVGRYVEAYRRYRRSVRSAGDL